VRFLADENIPRRAILYLRDKGLDIRSVAEENPGLMDEKILEQARETGRILLTFDRDYGHLIFCLKKGVPGLVYFHFVPRYPEECAELLWEVLSQGLSLEGYFTVIERDRVRQRPLPGPLTNTIICR